MTAKAPILSALKESAKATRRTVLYIAKTPLRSPTAPGAGLPLQNVPRCRVDSGAYEGRHLRSLHGPQRPSAIGRAPRLRLLTRGHQPPGDGAVRPAEAPRRRPELTGTWSWKSPGTWTLTPLPRCVAAFRGSARYLTAGFRARVLSLVGSAFGVICAVVDRTSPRHHRVLHAAPVGPTAPR